MIKFKFVSKNKIGELPQASGVYCFREGNKILYIGKATNLRERVKQHKELLSQVLSVGYSVTDSEIEALILEANLIKKYRPKYNVLWRDDKNYFYVVITKDKLPRIFITHQPDKRIKANYVGPFVEGQALKQTLKYLRKIFPYYSARTHPKTLCSWCHLNLCPGPPPEDSGEARSQSERQSFIKDYQKNIKNLIKVLKGKRKSVLRNLKKEMEKASQIHDFEKAAKLRDQTSALERIISHAKILHDRIRPRRKFPYKRIEAYDVSNIQGKFATGAMVTFIERQPDKNFYRRFKIRLKETPDDVAMLKEVLTRRFNHPEWPFPDLILVDGGKAQLNAAKLIAKSYKLKANVIALTKDKRHKGVKIYTAGKKEPTKLESLSSALRNLILRVDQEAHRFAISYHRKLRRVDLIGKY